MAEDVEYSSVEHNPTNHDDMIGRDYLVGSISKSADSEGDEFSSGD